MTNQRCDNCTGDIDTMLQMQRRMVFCCDECAQEWANTRLGMLSNAEMERFVDTTKRLLLATLRGESEEALLIRLIAVGVRLYPEVAEAARQALARLGQQRASRAAPHAQGCPPAATQGRIEMVQAAAATVEQKQEATPVQEDDALTSFP